MAKYSYKLKRRVVQDYLEGKGGYKTLSRLYGIAQSSIKNWIRAHQALGREFLVRSREKKTYSFECKMKPVELYLTTGISYQELTLSFDKILQATSKPMKKNRPRRLMAPLRPLWLSTERFAAAMIMEPVFMMIEEFCSYKIYRIFLTSFRK